MAPKKYFMRVTSAVTVKSLGSCYAKFTDFVL